MAPLPPGGSRDPAHILALRTFLSPFLADDARRNLVRRAFSHAPSSSFATPVLSKRQTIVAIPTTYSGLNSGPSPGTIVGIVLGSVVGFLLVLYLLYTLFAFGGGAAGTGRRTALSSITTDVVRERRGKSRPTRSRGQRHVNETLERVTTTTRRVSPRRAPAPPPPAPPAPIERVIVEERRAERISSSRPAPLSRRASEDEVVVIEEHSPPRRKSSRRARSRETAGGYRITDPLAYGGGGAPMREVSRKASSRRSRG